MTIYPNSATDVININNIDFSDFQNDVYNFHGHLVKSMHNSEWIEVEGFSEGTYVIIVTDQKSGQKLSEKVLIKK